MVPWKEFVEGMVEMVDLEWGKEVHWVYIGMKSQCRGMMWITNQDQLLSLLKPVSTKNYHQILQWNILQSFQL